MNKETVINLVAGGIGGTAGAVVTCPLEVVKTRLQSSALKSPPTLLPPKAPDHLASTAAASHLPDYASSTHKLPGASAGGGSNKGPAGQKRDYFIGKPRLKSTEGISTMIGQIRSRLVGGVYFYTPWMTPTVANSASSAASTSANRFCGHSAPVQGTSRSSMDIRITRAIVTSSHSGTGFAAPNVLFSANGQSSSSSSSSNRTSAAADGQCSSASGEQQQKNGKNFHQNSKNGSWRSLNIYQQLKYIVKEEGVTGLWRGLGPTLIGVAPSRAIYFCAYSNVKSSLNGVMTPDTPFVHMFSAATAGFCSATCTNPVWLIRTRLQLDRLTGSRRLTILKCMSKVYQENGLKGFYRGVTASYAGITETIIHFVIYEYLKSTLTGSNQDVRKPVHFLQYMLCAAASRLIATTTAYPHEVLRTRLREEGTKYKGLFHSFGTIIREETWRGLYSGLTVHLIRSIPNTAVTMATYELVVYLLREFT